MVLQYPAPRFALLATRAADRAATFPPDALAALVLSVVWVEAVLNQILHGARHALCGLAPETATIRAVAAVPDLMERAKILQKLAVISGALRGAPFPMGEQPFQDFGLLVQLRNHLVHLQPEIVGPAREAGASPRWRRVSRELDQRLAKLVERGIVTRHDEGNAATLTAVLEQASAARWAVNTAHHVVRRLGAAIPEFAGWRRSVLAVYEPYGELAFVLGDAPPYREPYADP